MRPVLCDKLLTAGCAVLLICTLNLAGCGTQAGQMLSNHVDFDLASQPTIYSDNWVRLSPVQIYVHPDVSPETPPKALFVPFRMTQRMEEATPIGRNISHIVWQTWLQNQVLGTIEFSNSSTPYRPDIALSLGRQRGADLVIGGYITHFLDGGTAGESVASIAVEAYDVRSGNLLWSMAQAGSMPRDNVSDYLLFAVKSRMPTDPVAAIVSAMARDMGLKIRDWANPQPPEPEESWFGKEPNAF